MGCFDCCGGPAERAEEFVVAPHAEDSTPEPVVATTKDELASGVEESVVGGPGNRTMLANMSDVSNDSPGTKEKKKDTLKSLVRQFCTEADKGVPVKWIDATGKFSKPAKLLLSKDKQSISIVEDTTDKPEAVPAQDTMGLGTIDQKDFRKGTDRILEVLPDFDANAVTDYCCAVTDTNKNTIVFGFQSEEKRNEIHYVLKVLSLVVLERRQKGSGRSEIDSALTGSVAQ
uniref:Uncharacterized protein n=1 Tax=Chromera velia CCMP2878 TaxID=1169474 RepID=A0A0K6S5Y7_9ALVE|eukprot:Cvel_15381.t1-p1 / transcript=Cvel_15381.t1 / gene=Cvel_15381 / organism=Chromera_velia_CCMP2878 / gene_product=hypothetical protein / transcript_product=hypothetical protein / location=Cvel_scaffold1135:16523-21471(-) / protein_length=229 / sequence_SO=supercontig / SO=protein_coding / is_pseudo=false